MRKLIFVLFFLFSKVGFTYVITKTELGKNIKWNYRNKQIPLYYNPEPVDTNIVLDISSEQLSNLSISKAEYLKIRVKQIIEESVAEWNQVSPYQVIPYQVDSSESMSSSKSTLRFSDDYQYFGSGVIAVTSTLFSATTGNISSADILINQSFTNVIDLTLDKKRSSKQTAYLGDVLTHEFGHFLGLAHSEVINSTMIFSIFKGQHTIHSDDIYGLWENYGITTNSGEISGKVIAGDAKTEVFGTNVNLMSFATNKVIQAVITDSEGKFSFKNLDLDESYFIAVSPIKNLSSISDYYKQINNQICAQESFRTSFFAKCGPRSKGRPQAFYLDANNNSVDVGEVTIRCDENLDTDYYAKKFKDSERSFELLANYLDTSAVFTGYFSSEEIAAGLTGKGDVFTLDYRNFDLSQIPLNPVVNINLSSSTIGSDFAFKVYVKLTNETSWREYSASTDSTGKLLTDLNIDIELSENANDNLIELTVYPVALSSDEKYEIFAAPTVLLNANNLYSITAQLGSSVAGNFYAYAKHDSYPYDDNSSCVEGTLTYASSPYISMSALLGSTAQLSEDDAPISCGTIDLDNSSGPGGMGSFVLGVIMVLIFFIPQKLNHIFLSDS